jgi:hypothetical protein
MTADAADAKRRAGPRRPPAGGRRHRSGKLAESFYHRALDAAEQIEMVEAAEVEGLDQEIALLRTRLRKVVDEKRDDFPLMLRGVDLLVKAVSARYRLSKEAEADLAASIANVVRGVGGQLLPEAFQDA